MIDTLLMACVCIFFGAFSVSQIAKELEKSKNSMVLGDKWSAARQDRTAWLSKHRHLPTPHLEPEYIELWEIEIGAEELLYIFHGVGNRSSYLEYCAEQGQTVWNGPDFDSGQT